MRRRTFLMAAATAMTLGPSWLRRAFADASLSVRQTERGALAAARERGRASGKPVLVLIIPADPGKVDQRGEVLGGWLDGGHMEELAPLALCEVVCAPAAELRALAPSLKGDPVLALVDGDRAIPLYAKLPDDDYRDENKEQEILDGRVATLVKLTREAVMGTPELLAARVKAVRAALPPAELAAIEAKLARHELPSLAETDRGAALVAVAAAKDPGLVKRMGEAVAARWAEQPVRGSHWAHKINCAGDVEAEGMNDLPETRMVGCGMGHVPERSARFLYFWTKPPRMLEKEERG